MRAPAAWLVCLTVLALPLGIRADEIVVYTKGETIRYDADVGADVMEAILVTHDTESPEPVKKETITTYFHLSDNQEIITVDKITDRCRQVFVIEQVGPKFFFRGRRPEGEEPPKPDAEPAPEDEVVEISSTPTKEEVVRSVQEKVRRVTREIVKINPREPNSAKKRAGVITLEFTTSLQDFDNAQLEQVVGYIDDEKLSLNQQYYVLRSFGYVFQAEKNYPRAIFFYDKCADLIPDNYSAHLQKAYAYELAGEHENALASYATALDIRPNKRVIYYFNRMTKGLDRTPRISPADLKSIRAKLAAVYQANRGGDSDTAKKRASELRSLVDSLLSGKPSSPMDEPPATPDPLEGL
ncbi:tetratricopeptide repeat protein [Planctomycetota bacterium]